MALGSAKAQQRFEHPREILGDRLREGSIYRLLADHGHRLFPDDYFADCYTDSKKGRPTIAARVMATVMVLQAFEGLSDREACDRLEVDLRWQAAAGVDTGAVAFHPTALVGQRNRLRASGRPRRLFEDTKVMANETGAMKHRARVLDSTPIFDAVATEDTVTQLRAAIRKLLVALDKAGSPLAAKVRSVLERDDDYATVGKPPCDWDDPAAREALVDTLVKDAMAALSALDGETLPEGTAGAVELLALVAGQDTEAGEDGVFRIVRKVARDRVISTVDPQARHGHKSRQRRFDGYKAHLSVDPDSELIDEVVATPANTHDREAATDLLEGLADQDDKPEVLGDSAYADGAIRDTLETKGFNVIAKCPPVRNSTGRFTKDRFAVDLEARTVTCPAGQSVAIITRRDGGGRAAFKAHCATCPLRTECTAARSGRRDHDPSPRGHLAAAPGPNSASPDGPSVTARTAPSWNARSPTSCGGPGADAGHAPGGSTRGHRPRHRAGAINWARLAVLGLRHDGSDWVLGAI